MSKKWKVIGAIVIIFAMIGMANNSSNGDDSQRASSQSSQRIKSNVEKSKKFNTHSERIASHNSDKNEAEQSVHQLHKQTKQSIDKDTGLASKNYHSGEAAYINVNGGKSTLKPNDWQHNYIHYAELDSLNRTSDPNTAYLEGRNVANDSLRTVQRFYPTGWHQKFINRVAIINRGHLIAYSLSKGISIDGNYDPNDQSGDQNNPKNLFTQTAFSNQRVQTIYETKVRNALRDGEKIIYQVQPVFRGDELMARGVHIQALSTDETLNFNVYLFNVQPGVIFDYATGRSMVDHSMTVPTPDDAPIFNNQNRHDDYRHTGIKSVLNAYGVNRIYKHYHHYRNYKDYDYHRHYYHRY